MVKTLYLHSKNLNVGDKIIRSASSLNIGNTLPLTEIPLGTSIHNIELIQIEVDKLFELQNISKTFS
jgi:ribosomal protein L2